MSSFPNIFSKSSKGTSAPPSQPTQIRNQFYNDMREFTAWHPWGQKPDHSTTNLNYIPMKDRFVKQFDYPAELQKLIDVGWKAGTTPTGPRKASFTLGAARATGPIDLTQKGPVNPLRRGFAATGRGGGAMANNWADMKLFEQVAAYAFRGDTRPPETVKAAGGFYPPSMRTDDFYKNTIAENFYLYMNRKEGLTLDMQGKAEFKRQVIGYMTGKGENSKAFVEYHFWREVLNKESMHLKTMTNDSFLKAYVSTTRDIGTAKGGAGGLLSGAGAVDSNGMFRGFVYAVRVKSGFLLKTDVGGITKTEAEISHLGPILWKNVYGFRQIMGADVYIRNTFDQDDNNAFRLVLASLSSV